MPIGAGSVAELVRVGGGRAGRALAPVGAAVACLVPVGAVVVELRRVGGRAPARSPLSCSRP
jgi:hypothetical protein